MEMKEGKDKNYIKKGSNAFRCYSEMLADTHKLVDFRGK